MESDSSRRSFLASTGGMLTSAWLSVNWPRVVEAAQHAAHAGATSEPLSFEFLSVSEAADVEAIAAQIVPSGATPGAREAHVVYFIDRALATFFADSAREFRAELAGAQVAFRAANPSAAAFAGVSVDEQIAFLRTIDRTPFFERLRMLTLLGMFSSPQYGGNYGGAGWKLLGFEDQHVFSPPFGDYDRDYGGFVPYGADQRS